MAVSARLPQFLKLYSDTAVFAAHDVVTKIHSHHAYEIIFSFDSLVCLRTSDGVTEAKGLLLHHDIPHATETNGFAAFIFINPETTLGKRFSHVLLEKKMLLLPDHHLDQ